MNSPNNRQNSPKTSVHLFDIRVYSEDTDCFGIVHHAKYMCFLSRARGEWLRAMGMSVDALQKQGFIFPVCSAKIDFLRPAYLGDLLSVHTQLLELKRASFVLCQRVTCGDTLLTKADVKLACVSTVLKPCALPSDLFLEMKKRDRPLPP